MPRSRDRWSRALRGPLFLAVASLFVLVACSDDGDGTPDPVVVEYQGVFGSASTAGRLAFGTTSADVRVPAARAQASIPLSGTMDFTDGTAQVALTGTLDGNNLSLSGGGYTFTGTQANGVISGTFTGPQNGTFTATLVPDGGFLIQLCGEYDGSDSGVFSLTIDGDRAGGVIIVPDDGSAGQTGRARPKAGSANEIEVLPDVAPTFVVATGTLNAAQNQVSGTWDDGQGNSGTFIGSVDACIAQ